MWRFWDFFRSIKNLIVWFPVIWDDRQWDSWYIEKLLLHKITLMRKYHEERKLFVGVENEIKWMKKCEYLLNMLIEYKYWEDTWDNKPPSNNGLPKGLIDYKQKIIDREPVKYAKDWEFLNSSNKCYADLWEYKARQLFWKIFNQRYQRWWD